MKEITASMAGTVWQVLVSEGDEVTAGQTVVILESMKMEIPVDAAEAGTVESIKFASGDFVNEGDVLVTLK
ncbi:acetyl-CoA carboxylase biotin carboxyl carrier protein subunit [Bacillus sp. NEB1478]|uniref:acetyl-CoA carboxylase biotin carboxyl carrier protein subunit n=1 Tax=Bacillus sp. NEB1478 TaxID=3073816 RepID=UPI0028736BB9|nr:acetyl-CoA carboxylase biotin carboxyl carrier protein subunit [Bacillus sp. NEB1478]WNB90499.1 acetyl-CoA carboxylase biotin carboxyl carrier protein subunit [Bacillus sp. NEB1478]